MSTEKMREEFEAWIVQYGYNLERDHEVGGYYSDAVDLAWAGWQASRAAMVVGLPKIYGIGGIAADAHDRAVALCRAAIESAGLRVKP